MQKIFVEGYGCSHNLSDTSKIKWLVKENLSLAENPKNADVIIFNGCTVKKPTENRMLNLIRKRLALKNVKSVVIFGCLARINKRELETLNDKKLKIIDSLPELCRFLSMPLADFSPAMLECLQNRIISILPISTGCLGNCSFCCVKKARGNLKSFTMPELDSKFKDLIKESKEVWLCSEDTGCYGLDIKSSLPKLLETLLSNKGKYRIRLGMMNPNWLDHYFDELVEIYKNEHMYKFLHLPLQSGSNSVLKAMNRPYAFEKYNSLVKELRKKIRPLTLSTDIIVGFPGETEEDFDDTIKALNTVKPDITNVSRYYNRPFAASSNFKNQIHGRDIKKRSRILSVLCRKLSFENNKKEIGKKYEILVNELGKDNTFVGRTLAYKSVVVKKANLGDFLNVKITSAKPTYLLGKSI
ncbi:MAG: threonylcarbamoyladenosine tRNA methylthiotransferase [Candidatus Diapherotrites archaeon CG08_land_8_20_14_0_20_34_12]|nr:MAG: threonylcarbamoyladenosine tRNA methylthiotransferase [Candidatus Diapherotrites archaeon CG08_land_8_20_14_0_20_34_12]